jgi:protein SCO1/2
MRGDRAGLSGLVSSSGTALVGGPFTLVDHTGREVSDETFHGRYTIVYFGYTYCPDVCPGTLQVLMSALDELGQKADDIQPLFVTVDPERDTVKEMARYVHYFGDTLIGLTGTTEQVEQAAKAYRVYFQRVEGDDGGPYLMDHTSILYLMGPDGGFVKHFNYDSDPRDLAAAIAEHLS